MVENGDKVKDAVSGFIGIATAKTEWITGCVRFGVEGRNPGGGRESPFFTFDEERLIILEKNAYRKAQKKTHAAGPQREIGKL